MDKIRVVVSGSGYMGREVLAALCREPDLQPVGVLEKFASEGEIMLPDSSDNIPINNDPALLLDLALPDVIIDFTNAEWTPGVVEAALQRNVRLVIGTTGLSDSFVADLDAKCREHGSEPSSRRTSRSAPC